MKQGIHPPYQPVAYRDTTAKKTFVIASSLTPEATTTIEGKEYPLTKVSASNYSHAFYTGKKGAADTTGRVDKFYKKYKK